MTETFQRNYDLSTKYNKEIIDALNLVDTIAGINGKVIDATGTQYDFKENADMLVDYKNLKGTKRVSCRVRSYKPGKKNFNNITIRTKTPGSNETEIQKFIGGYGDLIVLCIENETKDSLYHIRIIDAYLLRILWNEYTKIVKDDMGFENNNNDGTSYREIPVHDLPGQVFGRPLIIAQSGQDLIPYCSKSIEKWKYELMETFGKKYCSKCKIKFNIFENEMEKYEKENNI